MALAEIVARKRTDVTDRVNRRPLASFRDVLEPSGRGLAQALRTAGPALVCECKAASPTMGTIREGYAPAGIARQYGSVASAISVLADGPYFGGSLEHVREVSLVVDRPVLCKDFVVDPYQVYESRLHGADAILLMCSVLDDATLAECMDAVDRLSMDALVEVHDADELDRARAVGATLVGINNRNLSTLDVDLSTTEKLAPLVPDHVTLLAESGIGGRRDIRRLRHLVDGFLVGTHLMRHPHPGLAARELLHGRVKVCGITRTEDARAASAAGARFGGLVFADGSPRTVDLRQASRVREAAPELEWVGVFVDADPGHVGKVTAELGLDAVQLHGREDRGTVVATRRSVPSGCEVWKALRVEDRLPDLEGTGADRVLLDTHVKGRPGGTGRAFDWDLVRSHPGSADVMLAGGIGPANVEDADGLGTWGLDASSGLESSPGLKDPRLVDELFSNLRGRSREVTS